MNKKQRIKKYPTWKERYNNFNGENGNHLYWKVKSPKDIYNLYYNLEINRQERLGHRNPQIARTHALQMVSFLLKYRYSNY